MAGPHPHTNPNPHPNTPRRVKEKKGLLVAYHVLNDDAAAVMNFPRFAEFVRHLPRVSVRAVAWAAACNAGTRVCCSRALLAPGMTAHVMHVMCCP